ncbi:hypothetical protein [Rhodococcus sp. BS-15]|uniref:hypothetical protein n=1 Tax=Rhodococcus sp. BS-15 TaxID=1304954 RepID=UPI000A613907|nr:hypothetical protein [Rhodococcus sp. BS-15]
MGTKSGTIAGYTYQAENYRPGDLVELLISAGEAAPGARGMTPEEVLDQIAGERGIERLDERTFDSNDFPKVILEDQVTEDDRATWYGEDN